MGFPVCPKCGLSTKEAEIQTVRYISYAIWFKPWTWKNGKLERLKLAEDEK